MITTVAKMESCFRRSGSCFFKPFGATVDGLALVPFSRGATLRTRAVGTKLARSGVINSGPYFQRVIASAFLPGALCFRARRPLCGPVVAYGLALGVMQFEPSAIPAIVSEAIRASGDLP
jgi:hypothetical protein